MWVVGLARMAATTSATSRTSTGEVRPEPNGSRMVLSAAMDSTAQARKKKFWRNGGSDVHHRQSRPVQHLLSKPMLPLLG
jgi:hypothetical protein